MSKAINYMGAFAMIFSGGILFIVGLKPDMAGFSLLGTFLLIIGFMTAASIIDAKVK